MPFPPLQPPLSLLCKHGRKDNGEYIKHGRPLLLKSIVKNTSCVIIGAETVRLILFFSVLLYVGIRGFMFYVCASTRRCVCVCVFFVRACVCVCACLCPCAAVCLSTVCNYANDTINFVAPQICLWPMSDICLKFNIQQLLSKLPLTFYPFPNCFSFLSNVCPRERKKV